jgi:hypothetical protein
MPSVVNGYGAAGLPSAGGTAGRKGSDLTERWYIPQGRAAPQAAVVAEKDRPPAAAPEGAPAAGRRRGPPMLFKAVEQGMVTAGHAGVLSDVIDGNMLAQIAAEPNKGRRLFIGTTNLNAELPVIWNIGAITFRRRSGGLFYFFGSWGSTSLPRIFSAKSWRPRWRSGSTSAL